MSLRSFCWRFEGVGARDQRAAGSWLGLEALEQRILLTGEGTGAIELFGVSPAMFVENQGQWADASVRYLFSGSGAQVAHTPANEVSNTGNNYVVAGTLGTFSINLGAPDSAPTASLQWVTPPGAMGVDNVPFRVRYTDGDSTVVKAVTIGDGDVLVTGPNGYSQLAKLTGKSDITDTTPIDGTYLVRPPNWSPGVTWTAADNGTYTLSMVANEVSDTGNNYVVAGTLGTFSINFVNQAPNQPTNISPPHVATDVSLTPTLTASAFSDPDADSHAASQWVVWRTSDTVIVFDSGEDASHKTSITVPSGSLNYLTTYTWQVRYKDSGGLWSVYSLPFRFTTQAVNQAPNQPTNISPPHVATDVSLTPTLTASAFSDPDADSHAASQWVVWRTSDTVIVFDSGEDASHKTSITVPSGSLNYLTTYTWQVRYKDSGGLWSVYSLPFRFTTQAVNQAPNQPTNISPPHVATDVSLTPTLTASAFSDPDADSHAASQWVVWRTSDTVIVFDSGEDASHKTSITVPSGSLNYLTTYTWQVRYKDSGGLWSVYSLPFRFTTQANILDSAPIAALPWVTPPTTLGVDNAPFRVRYTDGDSTVVKAVTIGDGDVLVTGPNGYSQLAKLTGKSDITDTTSIDGTYLVRPPNWSPGVTWTAADNGTYTLSMVANEVSDTGNNYVVAGTLGTFSIHLPRPIGPGRYSGYIGDSPEGAREFEMYEFELTQAGTATLDVDAQAIGSGLDAYLRLFNAAGQELAKNDDADGRDPTISMMLSAGTYYVGVSGYANRAYNPNQAGSGVASYTTGEYSLTLSLAGQSMEDIAPGVFNVELAGPIQVGQQQTLTVWVKAPRAGIYQLRGQTGFGESDVWSMLQGVSLPGQDTVLDALYQFVAPAEGMYSFDFRFTAPRVGVVPAMFTLTEVPAGWLPQHDAWLAAALAKAGEDVFGVMDGLTSGQLSALINTIGFDASGVPQGLDVYQQLLAADHTAVSDATVAGYGIPGPDGTITTAAALAAAYAPVLKLSAGENFWPVALETMFAGSVLVDGRGTELAKPVTAEAMGQYAGKEMAMDLVNAGPLSQTSTAYWTLAEEDGRLALQYWFFYPYNEFPNDGLLASRLSHEGDWEMVTIVFDPSITGKVVGAGYSAHDNLARALGGSDMAGGYWHDWEQVQRVNQGGGTTATHPVVYVALGSHANFFYPGNHEYVPGITDVFNGQGAWMVPSGAAAGSGAGGTKTMVLSELPRLTEDLGDKQWLRFSGSVGGDKVDFNVGRYSSSPAMPPYGREEGPVGSYVGDYLGIGYGEKWIEPVRWARQLPNVADDAATITARYLPFANLDQESAYRLGQLAGDVEALALNFSDMQRYIADDMENLFYAQGAVTAVRGGLALRNLWQHGGLIGQLSNTANLKVWSEAASGASAAASLIVLILDFVNDVTRRTEELNALQSRIAGLSQRLTAVEGLPSEALGQISGRIQALSDAYDQVKSSWGGLQSSTLQLNADAMQAAAHLVLFSKSIAMPPLQLQEFESFLEMLPQILTRYETLKAGYEGLQLNFESLETLPDEVLSAISPEVIGAGVFASGSALGTTDANGQIIAPWGITALNFAKDGLGSGYVELPADGGGPIAWEVLLVPDGSSAGSRPVYTSFLSGRALGAMDALAASWADVIHDGMSLGISVAGLGVSALQTAGSLAAILGTVLGTGGVATPMAVMGMAGGLIGMGSSAAAAYGDVRRMREDAQVGVQGSYLISSLMDQALVVASRYGYSDAGLSSAYQQVESASGSNRAFMEDVRTVSDAVVGPLDAIGQSWDALGFLGLSSRPTIQYGTAAVPAPMVGVVGTAANLALSYVRNLAGMLRVGGSLWSTATSNPRAFVPGALALDAAAVLGTWPVARNELESAFGRSPWSLAQIQSSVTNVVGGVVDFGDTIADLTTQTASAAVATIANSGGQVLHVADMSIDAAGEAAGQFYLRLLPGAQGSLAAMGETLEQEVSEGGEVTVQFDLQPGESQEVEIVFDPTTVDAVTLSLLLQGDLVLTSSDPDELDRTITVPLQGVAYVEEGTVAVPDLVVSGPETGPGGLFFDFGQVIADEGGGDTRQAVLTLENQGLVDLTISSIVVSGDKAFRLTGGVANMVLRPGESQEVLVDCDPTVTGLLAGQITIESDDPDTPLVTVALTCDAGLPAIVIDGLADTQLDLGQTTIGVPKTATIVISNQGDMDLIVGWALEGSPSLSISSPAEQQLAIPPGETRDFVVSFQPSQSGPAYASLEITTNDPDHPAMDWQVLGNATVLVGDVNHDGAVNALDIESFVGVVTSGTYQAEADCNADGAVNALDIAGFVRFVTGAPLLGDVNRDGLANALDIQSFVQRVTTATYQVEADCNEDGMVNALDIAAFVRFVTGAPLRGDVNRDGAANALDIQSFVGRVTTATYQGEADCNEDGVVNALDIQRFVALITGAGGQAAAGEEGSMTGGTPVPPGEAATAWRQGRAGQTKGWAVGRIDAVEVGDVDVLRKMSRRLRAQGVGESTDDDGRDARSAARWRGAVPKRVSVLRDLKEAAAPEGVGARKLAWDVEGQSMEDWWRA